MFKRTPTDLTPTPDMAEPVELLPLSVVAAEMVELGIGSPDDLARHVGPERIVVLGDLVRCVTAATVAELARRARGGTRPKGRGEPAQCRANRRSRGRAVSDPAREARHRG